LAFFSVREEEVGMTTGAKIDPDDLFFLDPLFFHLSDIDSGKVHHPSPTSFQSGKGFPLRLKDLLIDFIATGPNGWAQGYD
jgi:hypothetical protein